MTHTTGILSLCLSYQFLQTLSSIVVLFQNNAFSNPGTNIYIPVNTASVLSCDFVLNSCNCSACIERLNRTEEADDALDENMRL